LSFVKIVFVWLTRDTTKLRHMALDRSA